MSEMNSLSLRLRAVAELASPCTVLADVGTDHGYLPTAMIQSGKCTKAFACDINDGPLQRARSTVEKNGLSDRITLIKSDGLHGVPDEYDTLVIAGMGGDLIARILYEHPPRSANRIVLQPMTKPEVLRRFLFRSGYSVLRERAISEGDRRYIIFLVAAVSTESFSETDCYLPQNLDCTPDALDYLEKLLNSHQRRLLGLRRADVFDENAVSFEEEISQRLKSLWQTVSRRLYDETHGTCGGA